MKEKLSSRKFWMSILAITISIVSIFTDLGGTVGTIFGIIGVVLSTIFYVLVEGKIDIEKTKADSEEIKRLIENLRKEGE